VAVADADTDALAVPVPDGLGVLEGVTEGLGELDGVRVPVGVLEAVRDCVEWKEEGSWRVRRWLGGRENGEKDIRDRRSK